MKKVERVFMAALMGLSVMFMSVSCGGNKDTTDTTSKEFSLKAGTYDCVISSVMDLEFAGLDAVLINEIYSEVVVNGTGASDEVVQNMNKSIYIVKAETDETYNELKYYYDNNLLSIFVNDIFECGDIDFSVDEENKTFSAEQNVADEDKTEYFEYSDFVENLKDSISNGTLTTNADNSEFEIVTTQYNELMGTMEVKITFKRK